VATKDAESILTASLAIKTGFTIEEPREAIFPYLTPVGGLKLAAQSFANDVGKLLLLPWIGKGYGNHAIGHSRLRLRRVWHAL
jgi:hypothetical protein